MLEDTRAEKTEMKGLKLSSHLDIDRPLPEKTATNLEHVVPGTLSPPPWCGHVIHCHEGSRFLIHCLKSH